MELKILMQIHVPCSPFQNLNLEVTLESDKNYSSKDAKRVSGSIHSVYEVLIPGNTKIVKPKTIISLTEGRVVLWW